MAIDGTDIDIFRNPDSDCFISSSWYPKSFCQLHINAFYDVLNRTYVDTYLQSKTQADERFALIEMLAQYIFKEKFIIMADRGYESYNVFAHFLNTPNVDFLCRVKQGAGGMRDIIKLPMQELDVDISTPISTSQTNEDKRLNRIYINTGSKKGKINSPKTRLGQWDFSSPYDLKMRIVRFETASGKYVTIATSLSREEFSIKEIKMLYNLRWGIETSFRELKYVMGLVNLHCKKEDLIAQKSFVH